MNEKINLRALFTDESSMFRTPEEPDTGDMITVRFRTLKNDVDKVMLHIQYDPEDMPVCYMRLSEPEKEKSVDEKLNDIKNSLENSTARYVSQNSKVLEEASQNAEKMKQMLEKKPALEIVDTLSSANALCKTKEGFIITKDNEVVIKMTLAESKTDQQFDSKFDYYEAQFAAGKKPCWYYFIVEKGGERVLYNKLGENAEQTGRRYNFVVRPNVHIPQWAKGAIFYQIFVDRFCNGDPSNDVLDREYLYVDGIPSSRVKSWDADILSLDVGRFYGGDLQGIMDKLDYLKRLGVEAIYFNPLFVSPSNHKYDTQDYDYIDPHYGVILDDEGDVLPESATDNRGATRYINRVTSLKNLEASNKLFEELCQKAHEKGIRIILDGVFNHCGSFNKWLDKERIYEQKAAYEKGAFVSENSAYHNYFHFNGGKWPYNKDYTGWWNNDTLPKLNYEESPKLYDYVMQIARKWVSAPFHVDGWRLDVAADLGNTREFNHKFWKDFHKNVKEANDDALILAEHYGDVSEWLDGDEWDTVMNYDAFMEPVSWFLTGLEKHSDRFEDYKYNNGKIFYDTMRYNMCNMHRGALLTAMNELSNHDHSRFMTRTNHRVGRLSYKGSRAAEEGTNKGIFREGVVIQMTWPGAPTIYYGDETGLCGWTDPDSRRPYPWHKQDIELIEFQKYMGKIHRENQALKTGSLKFLGYDYGLLMYGRFEGNNRIVVAVNNRNYDTQVYIPVWEIGIEDGTEMSRLLSTSEKSYNVGAWNYTVEDGRVYVKIKAYGAVILRSVCPEEDEDK